MGSVIEPVFPTDVSDAAYVRGQHPGCFVVIEGVDGAGKTTMAKRLVEKLNSDFALRYLGYSEAIYVREPGSTPFGDHLRAAFLEAKEPLHPMTEVLALLAAKNELIEKVIRPAIRVGKVVICDRFTRTLLAYQGGLREIPMVELVALLGRTGLLIMPNLELFLLVGEALSQQRRGKALNYMDTTANDHAAKLRQGFADALDVLPPTRRIDIDASGTEEEVFAVVHDAVRKHLKFHRVAGLTMNAPIHDYQPEAPVQASAQPELAATDDIH